MAKRKNFNIRIERKLVSVTEEVYLAYYRMERRERYLVEKDTANGKELYSDMDTDETLGEETIPDLNAKSIADLVADKLMVEKLNACLELLTESERELIIALFFNGYSEREWSEKTGIPRKTINNRRHTILAKLKKLLES